MIHRALLWLDASAGHYEACAWTCFLVLLVATALPFFAWRRPAVWWLHPGIYAGAVLICALAFRWPSLESNREFLNPDESQLLSASITLSHDPLFFRSVDGATVGPIEPAPLAALAILGVRLDYRLSHALALGLMLGCAGATWMILRRLFGDAVARLGTLPLVCLIVFCDFWDFLQYSSEQLPVFLIALACCLMVLGCDTRGGLVRPWLLGLCGLALGAVPFTKLQGAPIALYCAVAACLQIATARDASWNRRLRAVGILTAGSLAIPMVVVAIIALGGQWEGFCRSYIWDNIRYAGARCYGWADSPAHLMRMMDSAWGFDAFVWPQLVFLLLAALAVPARDPWPKRMVLFSLGLLLVSAFAVSVPGRDFQHYLQFLIFPVALSAGCFLGAGFPQPDRRGLPGDEGEGRPRLCPAGLRTALVLLGFGLGLGVQVGWKIQAAHRYLGRYTLAGSTLQVSEPAREIMRHARPGDALAIWGWTPALWVETGLRQGTREGNSSRQIEKGVHQTYYLQRYLEDMKRNRPAIFVDSVGRSQGYRIYTDRASAGHEQFPELAAHIASEYRMVAEVDSMRIYVRKDLPL